MEILQQIAASLRHRDLYLCTAESCTGGLLGHIITNMPGASDFYLGGQITYSNQAKIEWLNVPEKTIEKHGAVSKQTVLAMARGIRATFSSSHPPDQLIGISISGIAGPSGGSAQKPVGTVWVGISMPGREGANHFLFSGDREAIKHQSAMKALEILLYNLKQ